MFTNNFYDPVSRNAGISRPRNGGRTEKMETHCIQMYSSRVQECVRVYECWSLILVRSYYINIQITTRLSHAMIIYRPYFPKSPAARVERKRFLQIFTTVVVIVLNRLREDGVVVRRRSIVFEIAAEWGIIRVCEDESRNRLPCNIDPAIAMRIISICFCTNR